jgi:hypothetical protein
MARLPLMPLHRNRSCDRAARSFDHPVQQSGTTICICSFAAEYLRQNHSAPNHEAIVGHR